MVEERPSILQYMPGERSFRFIQDVQGRSHRHTLSSIDHVVARWPCRERDGTIRPVSREILENGSLVG